MKKPANLFLLLLILFISCNTSESGIDGLKDTLISAEGGLREDVNFSAFLALFEDFKIGDEEIMFIPPQEFYFKDK